MSVGCLKNDRFFRLTSFLTLCGIRDVSHAISITPIAAEGTAKRKGSGHLLAYPTALAVAEWPMRSVRTVGTIDVKITRRFTALACRLVGEKLSRALQVQV